MKRIPLIQLIGHRGDGKTFFVVKHMANLTAIIADIDIYSNFKLNFPTYHKLQLHELLRLPPEIILGMDELYNLVNARLSMSYVNIFASHIAFQMRKTATLIFVTMTQLRTIDVLYREEWDTRIYCTRTPNEEEDWRLWDFFYEVHDRRTGNIAQWIITYQEAEKYFYLYNTNEIIKPRYISRIEYEFLLADPLGLSNRSRDIAKKIAPIMKKITKDEVEWALKRSGFDKVWKNDVYIELKHLELVNK